MAGVRRGDTPDRNDLHFFSTAHQDHFTHDVDPYITPGDPSSGLLPHIKQHEPPLVNSTGDQGVQAYNYRVTVTNDPDNRIPFAKPEGYRELDYELLFRNFEAGDTRMPLLRERLPNNKQDWNTLHAVSTDLPGPSWDYPEGDYATRERIEKEYETYTRGLLWTWPTTRACRRIFATMSVNGDCAKMSSSTTTTGPTSSTFARRGEWSAITS
jgi:hypothetical protein